MLGKYVDLQIRTNRRNLDPDTLFTAMSRGERFVIICSSYALTVVCDMCRCKP